MFCLLFRLVGESSTALRIRCGSKLSAAVNLTEIMSARFSIRTTFVTSATVLVFRTHDSGFAGQLSSCIKNSFDFSHYAHSIFASHYSERIALSA